MSTRITWIEDKENYGVGAWAAQFGGSGSWYTHKGLTTYSSFKAEIRRIAQESGCSVVEIRDRDDCPSVYLLH